MRDEEVVEQAWCLKKHRLASSFSWLDVQHLGLEGHQAATTLEGAGESRELGPRLVWKHMQ